MKTKKKWLTVISSLILVTAILSCSSCNKDDEATTEDTKVDNLPNITGFPIVGTNQTDFFDASTIISAPSVGDDYYGQNATYPGTTPSYTDNGDGTVTDNVTGLMWQNTLDHNGDPSIDYDDKLTYDEILDLPETFTTGGHIDWRVPSIKEQYSLITLMVATSVDMMVQPMV